MFKAIKSGKYDFPSPFWDDVEPGAKDMIGCLLVLDTKKRYSAEQVKYQVSTGWCKRGQVGERSLHTIRGGPHCNLPPT